MTPEQRLARLEGAEEIRQLACRYAIAIDTRAIDLIMELCVDDVRVGQQRGRTALWSEFDRVLRRFTTSVNQIVGHVFDFDDDDDARGIVTCRADNEVCGHWVSILLHYHDRYVRCRQQWYFRGRSQTSLFGTASDDPPVGEKKMRWPGAVPSAANFHDAFPSWSFFWKGSEDGAISSAPADGGFVVRLRGTTRLPPAAPDFMD